MFATRSIVHAVGVLQYGCQLAHVSTQDCMYAKTECIAPTCRLATQTPYTLSIYRKFTHLLITITKLANWQNRGMIVGIATKSGCQIVCHPRFKTGKSAQNWQNFSACTTLDFGLVKKLAKKLANTYVTPVTQITESLSTRHTMWYNGWYNNHLRES